MGYQEIRLDPPVEFDTLREALDKAAEKEGLTWGQTLDRELVSDPIYVLGPNKLSVEDGARIGEYTPYLFYRQETRSIHFEIYVPKQEPVEHLMATDYSPYGAPLLSYLTVLLKELRINSEDLEA